MQGPSRHVDTETCKRTSDNSLHKRGTLELHNFMRPEIEIDSDQAILFSDFVINKFSETKEGKFYNCTKHSLPFVRYHLGFKT